MRLKIPFLLLTVCLLTVTAWAQEYQKPEFKQHQKLWESGPLTASDFQGQPDPNSLNQSELVYQIGFFPEKLKREDTSIYRLHAYSFMDRQKSWLKPEANLNQVLLYNQKLFKLVKLYEQNLQVKLTRIENLEEAEQITNEAFSALKKATAEFEQTTQFGRDLAGAQPKHLNEEYELEEPENEILPPLLLGKVAYGVHGGPGYSMIGGNLSDYFRNQLRLALGFDVHYNRLALVVNGAYGYTKVKQDFTEVRIWPKTIGASLSQVEASLGYQVVNTGKLRLMPFAGWSVVEISANDRTLVYRDHKLSDHSFSAGLALDYKLRHRINLIPGFFGTRQDAETSLRTRVAFNPVSFNSVQKGSVISLSTEIYFGTRLLKIK